MSSTKDSYNTQQSAVLANTISSILSAPHISIPTPPVGITTAPGPIDLFSTRFANAFSPDVVAIIDGKPVTLDALKASLLVLQKRWDPKAQFVPVPSLVPELVSTLCTWTLADGESFEFEASAKMTDNAGGEIINKIILQGDQTLFNDPQA